MSEDRELSRLEKEWKNRFDRYTSPEPTTEQTLRLLAAIKATDAGKPADLRLELETAQSAQSFYSKLATLLLSQWNLYGMRSWLLTGAIMLLVTVTISVSAHNETAGLLAWIKWISLLMIAAMGFAFRPKNKGNDMIEQISYYSLIHQMFARFTIVMALQAVVTLPLSFMIFGSESSVLHILGSLMPIFFFGVVGFVGAMWLGHRAGIAFALIVWFGQMLLDQRHKAFSMFQLPLTEHTFWVTAGIIALSSLLLGSVLLRNGLKRGYK